MKINLSEFCAKERKMRENEARCIRNNVFYFFPNITMVMWMRREGHSIRLLEMRDA